MGNETTGTKSIGATSYNFNYNPYAGTQTYPTFATAPISPMYCDDLLDSDFNCGMYPSMYGGYNPMSMNGSIFGGMPFYGGMPYNNQMMYDNMRQSRDFYIDNNVETAKRQRSAEVKVNAPVERIKNAMSVLQDKINRNEQEQIIEAYNKFVDVVAEAYPECSREEAAARAKTIYTENNDGKSIVEHMRDTGRGSFTQGFLHALTFGFADNVSTEENISVIRNAPVDTDEKCIQNAGRILGGIGAGITTGGILSLMKFGKPGKLLGLAIAAGATILSFGSAKKAST